MYYWVIHGALYETYVFFPKFSVAAVGSTSADGLLIRASFLRFMMVVFSTTHQVSGSSVSCRPEISSEHWSFLSQKNTRTFLWWLIRINVQTSRPTPPFFESAGRGNYTAGSLNLNIETQILCSSWGLCKSLYLEHVGSQLYVMSVLHRMS